MKKYGIFSVSQFARLSQVTREIVLNYDKLGLISPTARDGKNYRYYSSDQLAIANLVRIQLELGTPLAKIKQSVDKRTPENVCDILGNQLKLIEAKIEELKDTQKFMTTFQQSISSAANIDEHEITVQFLLEDTIILGEMIDYSKGSEYDALKDFYSDITEKYPNANLNYPVWAVFSKKRIQQRDWVFPDRYYSYNPKGTEKRPAALYAIGYTRGGYGQTDDVYERLLAYIEKNGFEICGDTYEEYPLNEVCISNSENYLIRVMITVCEKNKLMK